MKSAQHPVNQEELMAYLDGELPVERAGALAAHLKECPECQSLAADLRAVSERLMAWQVEPSPARLGEKITQEAKAQPKESASDKSLSGSRERPRRAVWRWALGFSAAGATLIFLVAIALPNLLRSRQAANRLVPSVSPAEISTGPSAGKWGGNGGNGNQPLRVFRKIEPNAATASQPMIARTAQLDLITKDFDGARAGVERIVREHQGYITKLDVSGATGAARSMTATLRIPASQLQAALDELKKVARVVQESQSGEEVTRQYADLNARLSNARVTEERLNSILRNRTGKVSEVLEVEQEISRVRGEIERMEAERRSLETRVNYATIEVSLSEDYKAEMNVAPASTSTELWNAAVAGYRSLVNSALGLVMAILQYGPAILFWVALFFWPARLAWRKWRTLGGN